MRGGFVKEQATNEIYNVSLQDALPIYPSAILLNMGQEGKLNVSGTLLLRHNRNISTTHWYSITTPFSLTKITTLE